MSKNIIKYKLRESLLTRLREVSKTPSNDEEDEEGKSEKDGKLLKKDSFRYQGNNGERRRKKDYDSIVNYFSRNLHFSQVDVMKSALGWPDDKNGANRSFFGKKLHQDENPDGGLHQFSDDELDSVRSAIKNKQ